MEIEPYECFGNDFRKLLPIAEEVKPAFSADIYNRLRNAKRYSNLDLMMLGAAILFWIVSGKAKHSMMDGVFFYSLGIISFVFAIFARLGSAWNWYQVSKNTNSTAFLKWCMVISFIRIVSSVIFLSATVNLINNPKARTLLIPYTILDNTVFCLIWLFMILGWRKWLAINHLTKLPKQTSYILNALIVHYLISSIAIVTTFSNRSVNAMALFSALLAFCGFIYLNSKVSEVIDELNVMPEIETKQSTSPFDD